MNLPRANDPRPTRGFTLIEMLTTVAVVAVTTTVGVPALTGFVAGNRAAAQINTLIGALNYARSEAVSSARQVSLCPYTENPAASDPAVRYTCASATTWQQGWIVFRTVVDESGTATGDRLVGAVERGVDMFDCVLPSRNARNGQIFTSEGVLNMRNAKHAEDSSPIDPNTNAPTKDFSKAYLHHLFKADEILACMLATWQNLQFYQDMMKKLRE